MKLIRCRTYRMEVPGWETQGCFRLAFLSDLHNNIYPGLSEMLLEAEPDAVLLGGDMINRPTRHTPPRFTRGYGCIAKLAEHFPVYYALGNHEASWKNSPFYGESWRRYRRALEKKGVVFLENASVRLGSAGRPLYLSGLDLPKEQFTHHRKRRKAPTLRTVSDCLGRPRPFQILAAHHPDYIEVYEAWGADLVLSGHLHGGQARLPFAGGVFAPGPRLFPPYTKGEYRKGACRMLVSPGLGTHTIPFRVFNPREVFMIDLVKEPNGTIRQTGQL